MISLTMCLSYLVNKIIFRWLDLFFMLSIIILAKVCISMVKLSLSDCWFSVCTWNSASYKNLLWVWGADRKICPSLMMPNSEPEGQIFYPHETTMIDSFSCIPSDFNVGVTINESHFYADIRHIESWRHMWCLNDDNFQHLNHRVTWPPRQPMYW